MEKSAPSDPELLADWLGRQREPAFHALVARYAVLVHATARRTCGDDSMAAEVWRTHLSNLNAGDRISSGSQAYQALAKEHGIK